MEKMQKQTVTTGGDLNKITKKNIVSNNSAFSLQ
jgi:hypothetical protein